MILILLFDRGGPLAYIFLIYFANIISGDIEFLGGAPIGGLVLIVNGESRNIDGALTRL
jgi:hypothetical protein